MTTPVRAPVTHLCESLCHFGRGCAMVRFLRCTDNTSLPPQPILPAHPLAILGSFVLQFVIQQWKGIYILEENRCVPMWCPTCHRGQLTRCHDGSHSAMQSSQIQQQQRGNDNISLSRFLQAFQQSRQNNRGCAMVRLLRCTTIWDSAPAHPPLKVISYALQQAFTKQSP